MSWVILMMSSSCPRDCPNFSEKLFFPMHSAVNGSLVFQCCDTVGVGSSPSGPVDSCTSVAECWWAVNGERELCKWEPGCCLSVGKSGGHLNIQPQGQRSNSFPLNMPHKEKGSDKMARSAQARICILMCLSESLWRRSQSTSDYTTPCVAAKQPVIATTHETPHWVIGSCWEKASGAVFPGGNSETWDGVFFKVKNFLP